MQRRETITPKGKKKAQKTSLVKGFLQLLVSLSTKASKSRNFLALAGLVALSFAAVGLADILASENDYYRLQNPDKCVIFSLNGGPNFMAMTAEKHRPSFLPENDLNDILKCRLAAKGMMIWNDALFPKMRQNLRGNPWIAKVTSLSRRFPHFLQVSLRIRIPYAVIDFGGADHFVDKYGILLPLELRDTFEQRLVRIIGIEIPPPHTRGSEWESGYLKDALDLLYYLQNNLIIGDEFVDLLSTIRLVTCEPAHETLRTGKPKLTLMLESGCRIIWEMYNIEDKAFGRPGRTLKLRNLKKCLKAINDIGAVDFIDLSLERATVEFK